MIGYEVIVPKRVQRQIQTIPLPWRERVSRAIEFLAESPFLGEKMHGKFGDRRKVRIWPHRIFYRLYSTRKLITIVAVRHRGSAGYT